MIDIDTKNRFIELRAQGKSLRTIAAELSVGRQTLVNWERKHKERIENLTAMELDALLERHRLTAQARVERFGGQLNRVMKELEQRDFSGIKTPKLVDLALKLDAHLRQDTSAPAITDEAGLKARKDTRILLSHSVLHGPMQGSEDRYVAEEDTLFQLGELRRRLWAVAASEAPPKDRLKATNELIALEFRSLKAAQSLGVVLKEPVNLMVKADKMHERVVELSGGDRKVEELVTRIMFDLFISKS